MISSHDIRLLISIFGFIKGSQCFKFLKRRYPSNIVGQLDRLMELKCKVARERTKLDFFNDCIQSRNFPHTYFKLLRNYKEEALAENLERIARDNIDTCTRRIIQYTDEQVPLSRSTECLSLVCHIKYINFCHEVVRRTKKDTVSKLRKSVSRENPKFKFPVNFMDYVKNLSSITLERVQAEALSLGVNFKVPQLKQDKILVDAEFESLYDQLSDLTPSSDKNCSWLKAKLVDIAHSYSRTPCRYNSCLTKEHFQALRDLKRMDNIVILKPDKGSGVVVMNKNDYIRKVEFILEDATKFQVMPSLDTNPDVEKHVTHELKTLLMHGYITETQFKYLKPTGTRTPQLYGLPKIHKPGTPMRPILSMCNSAHHQVAKWLNKVLEPVMKAISVYSVRDTFEVVRAMRDMNVEGKLICSLDVKSLFTNVPLLETIDFICGFVSTNNIVLPFPNIFLKDLLLLCTHNIKFRFQENFYKQIDGVAMGSPLGPTLANIFMAMMEKRCEDSIKKLAFYGRYVDDILLVASSEQELTDFMSEFNDLHPNLEVTCERENYGTLGFLDIKFTRRNDGSLKRSIFRKSTWTGQYLHFLSFQPIQQKRALIRTLFKRARAICSHDTLLEEIAFLESTLQRNGYPLSFIRHHRKSEGAKQLTEDVQKKAVFIKLPFKGDSILSQTAHRLKSAIKLTYHAADLRILSTTRSLPLPSIKTNCPISESSHCIYKFQCSCSDFYLGRTDRNVQSRMAEHIPKWLRQELTKPTSSPIKSNRNPLSSIAKHLMTTGHKVDPESAFTIILRNQRPQILKIAEAIMITRLKPGLCVQKQLAISLRLPWI